MSPLSLKLKLRCNETTVLGMRTAVWRIPPSASANKSPVRLVLVHGHGGNHEGLLPLAAELQEYERIIPDLPGHGNSDIPADNSFAFLADWLRAFLQTVQAEDPKVPLVVIGHSMGGLLLLHTAKLHGPVPFMQSVVLLNPVPRITPFVHYVQVLVDHLPTRSLRFLEENWVAHYLRLRYLLIRNTAATCKITNYLWKTAVNNNLPNYRFYRSLGDQLAADRLFFELDPAEVPKTFCIIGEKDNLVDRPSQGYLKMKFGAEQVLTCPNAGHLMPIEAAHDTAEIIRRIIRS